jgi:hypothetical protein
VAFAVSFALKDYYRRQQSLVVNLDKSRLAALSASKAARADYDRLSTDLQRDKTG